ncbi:SANT/Myb-like DNA-binding domain-containing protein [Sphingomonas sp.]|uniref:SANT/Myb-like DNA-binding domain-containing protein n=1 Tax=Sphingomonas sp. TaxID=28214 RepID=UPI00307D0B9B
MKHYAPWTPEEIATLRREYPRGGYKRVARLLTHRSLDTIRMRASALGVRAPRGGGNAQHL